MTTLKAMRTFIEIAERESLTDAAEALGRSLPTVVRTLADLEEALGVTLIHRTTRRMSLSQEGHLYLERARQILEDVDQAADLVSGKHAPRGELRIGAPVLFGQMHITPLSIAFAKMHEAIDVQVLLHDRIVDLIEERIDVALRIGALQDSTLIAQKVGRMRRVIVASPRLLKEVGVPTHPHELSNLPGVHFLKRGPKPWLFCDEQGETIKVLTKAHFSVNQIIGAVQACEASMGFGCFLHYQVEEALKNKRLKVVLKAFELDPLPVHLVYPGTKIKSARLQAYLGFMKKALREVRSLRH